MADTYKVQPGDCLWLIAKRELGDANKWTDLAELNDIESPYYIYVGQEIKLSGSASPSTSTGTATNSNRAEVVHFGLQADSDRTLYATWTWAKHDDHTEKYTIRWWYATADNIPILAKEEDHDQKVNLFSSYDPPANAIRAWFHVKPISEQKKDSNGNDIGVYWEAEWSTSDEKSTYYFSGITKTPDQPSVTIEKHKLTATLENIDAKATGVEFQIIRFDTKEIFNTSNPPVEIYSGAVSYSCTITAGGTYQVRCRYTDGELRSEWSNYSTIAETVPSVPSEIISCKAATESSVTLTWAPVENADNYEIQYTTNQGYFDTTDEPTTESTTDAVTTWTITDLDSGSEYFFRVRAVNEKGSSGWSEIKSTSIGTKPAAPTTWASTTTAIRGEPLTLYWVHNSADGSNQSSAQIQLTVNGESTVIPVRNWYIVEFDNGVYTATTDLFDPSELHGTRVEGAQVTVDNETCDVYICTDLNGATVYYCNIDNPAHVEENLTHSYRLDTTDYDVGVKIEWRVRTAGIMLSGDNGGYSDWSTPREISIYTPASLQLTVTDHEGSSLEVLTSFPFKVKALAGPREQAPIGYYLTISSDTSNDAYVTTDGTGNQRTISPGDVLYSEYFDISNTLETTFSAGNIDLENNYKYKISCTVSMNSGLTADATHIFTVGWTDVQYVPNAEITVDKETYSASIRPYCEEYVPVYNTVTEYEPGKFAIAEVSATALEGMPVIDYIETLGKNLINEAAVYHAPNINTLRWNYLDRCLVTEGVPYGAFYTLDNPIPAGTTYTLTISFKQGYIDNVSGTELTIGGYYLPESGQPSWQGEIQIPKGRNLSGRVFTVRHTATQECNKLFFFSYGEGINFSTPLKFNVQLELGRTATEYTPHQGYEIHHKYTDSGNLVYSNDDGYFCITEEKRPVKNVLLSVYRREFDGGLTELATGLPNTKTVGDLVVPTNTFITDPHPSLDYARYRIVAVSEDTGAVGFYDMPGYPIHGKSVIIQWAETWSNFEVVDGVQERPVWSGSLLNLPYNIDVSDRHSVDVSTIEYVGRKHPVTYYGTQVGQTSSWSMAIEKSDKETLYALRRLGIWTGDAYVREPSGSGYWANVSVSFSQKHGDLTIPVTLDITRVEGGV